MTITENDNGFSRIIKIILGMLELGLFWLVFSIPVFTVGASTCAAYYVMLKLLCEDEVSVSKMFFKAFKDNFKQGTLMWLISLPCLGGCFFMWRAILQNGDVNIILKGGAVILTLIAVAVNLYTYPLLARYDNTIKKSIMNSIVICALYIARTIITVAVVATEVVLIYFAFSLSKWTLIVSALIGPILIIFTISAISKKVFLDSEKNGGAIIPPAVQIQQEIDAEKAAEEKDNDSTDSD